MRKYTSTVKIGRSVGTEKYTRWAENDTTDDVGGAKIGLLLGMRYVKIVWRRKIMIWTVLTRL